MNWSQGWVYVNSWQNIQFIPALFGIAIDHLWVSSQHTVFFRNRISQFTWSDHYSIQTHISFAATQKH
ncbi:MAG: hypothetical protein HRT51_19045 [Colwellia sp.]|nr:hypothetical protein [Colwellia sp.]